MYVGQTKRSIRERIGGHRAALKNKKNMPLYRHIWSKGHKFEELKITIVEKVEDLEEKELEN